MKKYKLTYGRTREGKKLDWSKESIIESSREPKVGEGIRLLTYPPIDETIVKVELIEETAQPIDECAIEAAHNIHYGQTPPMI